MVLHLPVNDSGLPPGQITSCRTPPGRDFGFEEP